MALADFRNSIVTQDKFSGTFNKFDQAVSKSARGADTAAKALGGGGLMALAGGAAGVFAAQQIGRTVWELGELGAQSLTTKESFASLMSAVGQSPALLDRLSAAAGGTITEMTLMQQANSALAGTTGQLSTEMAAALPKLLEAGRAAAKLNPAYGDAAFMFQSLVSGVKRGTPMLIDNTGITLKIGEATEAYAASVGKSVTELTAQERSLAILRATLEGADVLIKQAGTSTQNYTTDMQRAKVAIEEMKTALGELAAPTVAGAAGGLADLFDSARIQLTGTEMEKLANNIRGVSAELARIDASDAPEWWKDLQRAAQGLLPSVGELMAKYQAMNAPLQNAARLTAEYGGAASTAAGDTSVLANEIMALAAGIMGGASSLRSFASGIQSIFAAAGATGSTRAFLGGVDVYSQQQYVAITQQRINMERALNVQVAAHMLTQQQADYQLATFDNRVNDNIGSLRAQATALGNVGGAMDTYGDKLKGLIGQQLKPTFDLSGLTGGALGGMAGDTFDEAYKRLAAVALRPEELQIHAGDWASTFEQAGLTGLTPEEAQARAKELVEAYSKGLDFSLIDREAIKDSVRQAIKAEELYNSVVDEIYAEMGKPNPKAGQAGYALGKQIGGATVKALKDMAPDAVAAMANAVAPSVAKIIIQDLARYKQ